MKMCRAARPCHRARFGLVAVVFCLVVFLARADGTKRNAQLGGASTAFGQVLRALSLTGDGLTRSFRKDAQEFKLAFGLYRIGNQLIQSLPIEKREQAAKHLNAQRKFLHDEHQTSALGGLGNILWRGTITVPIVVASYAVGSGLGFPDHILKDLNFEDLLQTAIGGGIAAGTAIGQQLSVRLPRGSRDKLLAAAVRNIDWVAAVERIEESGMELHTKLKPSR